MPYDPVQHGSSPAATQALCTGRCEGTPFTAALDARCQRGLHWRFTLDDAASVPASGDTTLHQLITAEPRIVHSRERWGDHVLDRYVLPFRFELRVWVRPGELSFIHRATAKPAQRDADRAALEGLLRSWWNRVEAP